MQMQTSSSRAAENGKKAASRAQRRKKRDKNCGATRASARAAGACTRASTRVQTQQRAGDLAKRTKSRRKNRIKGRKELMTQSDVVSLRSAVPLKMRARARAEAHHLSLALATSDPDQASLVSSCRNALSVNELPSDVDALRYRRLGREMKINRVSSHPMRFRSCSIRFSNRYRIVLSIFVIFQVLENLPVDRQLESANHSLPVDVNLDSKEYPRGEPRSV